MQSRKRTNDMASTTDAEVKRLMLVESTISGCDAVGKIAALDSTNDGKGAVMIEEPDLSKFAAISSPAVNRLIVLKLSELVCDRMTDWDWYSSIQEPKWIAGAEMSFLPAQNWIKVGPEKLATVAQHKFCDRKLVKNIQLAKSSLNRLDSYQLSRAKEKCFPLESHIDGFFESQSALILANMDCVCENMFIFPRDISGKGLVMPSENKLLFFADTCAGPGNFLQYVFWRRRWKAKGFGFLLRGNNDLKLEYLNAASAETFELCHGKDGDGDICKPANIIHFQQHVLANTDGQGVHFTISNGGSTAKGQENNQEILSHQLHLCQCLVALSITRPSGHFVLKLFDLFTPFSAGLIWLMKRSFREISIFKPNTSSSESSERYLVCKFRLEDVSAVKNHMWAVNQSFGKLTPGRAVLSIVPKEIIAADAELVDYLTNSNNELAHRQTFALAKIFVHSQNPALVDARQIVLKERCLDLWGIPSSKDTLHTPMMPIPEDALASLGMRFRTITHELTPSLLESELKMLDFKGYAITSLANPSLFLSVGFGNVFYLERGEGKWINAKELNAKLELPVDTLVFAELVSELHGEASAQTSIKVLHVMDAHVLGGIKIGHLGFDERVQCCQLFAKAVNRPTRKDLTWLYVKEPFALDHLDLLFRRIAPKIIKHNNEKKLCFMLDDKAFFVIEGITFLQIVLHPWTISFSKTFSKKYWFNTKTAESLHHSPAEAIMPFEGSVNMRLDWRWDTKVAMGDTSRSRMNSAVVHRENLIQKFQFDKIMLKMVQV